MLAVTYAAQVVGISGIPITVEVHVGPGLPGFTIVGLPDAACREARDRVRAAILSSRFTFPNTRITVNLAPSEVRKTGSGLDLAIAVGILLSAEVVKSVDPRFVCIGELGLDGSIRPVVGALCAAAGFGEHMVLTSIPDAERIAELGHERARGFQTLSELVACLNGTAPLPDAPTTHTFGTEPVADLADVRGQPLARFALEIAAAGGHNLLFNGPPGAGKSMLAQRVRGILPPLCERDALTVAMAHSAAGIPWSVARRVVPFRAPHHTMSQVGLIGGGTKSLRPGEITLAHRGVLFLDELGEFARSTLDALRQPMEEGVVRIARAHAVAELPAHFQLLAAMNPCPCGHGGEGCVCSPAAIQRYHRRVSGPVLDRFDLRVHVPRVTATMLTSPDSGEPSTAVRGRVLQARSMAGERGVRANVELPPGLVDSLCPFDRASRHLIETQVNRARLSGRGVRRVRLVARTIADLAGREGPPIVDDYAQAIALRVDMLGTAA